MCLEKRLRCSLSKVRGLFHTFLRPTIESLSWHCFILSIFMCRNRVPNLCFEFWYREVSDTHDFCRSCDSRSCLPNDSWSTVDCSIRSLWVLKEGERAWVRTQEHGESQITRKPSKAQWRGGEMMIEPTMKYPNPRPGQLILYITIPRLRRPKAHAGLSLYPISTLKLMVRHD